MRHLSTPREYAPWRVVAGRLQSEMTTEERFGEKLYRFTPEEWALVSQEIDFYGYNCYQGTISKYPIDPMEYDDYSFQGSPKSTIGWNVTPEALYWSAKFLYGRYQKPILITEKGITTGFKEAEWEKLI